MDMTTHAKPITVIQDDACCSVPVAPNLRPERAAEIAERLKALADATRLRMLDLLAQQREPICVCDITVQFDQHQPTISHHLRILREAGLVDCEKRGVWAYYWVTDAGKRALDIVTAL
jgi:ArsR family transcriptional regulator, arsenate/arsenite/antimonite-responsive transcriptional repressor